jgi:predicted SnoaL-like aldol condensation-catalyzing enzyme
LLRIPLGRQAGRVETRFTGAPGIDDFAFVGDTVLAANNGVNEVVLIGIAQGDLVSIRYHYQANATDLGKAVVEVFRVRGGKIVEHWDTHQDVPATAQNPNRMF